MALTSTTRAGNPSSSRYIEVYRGNVYISRHSDEFEAVEAASSDAEALGAGAFEYEFRYPNKMILIERTGVIQPPPVVPPTLSIASVNGGTSPYSNQNVVTVIGSGFGATQAVATYSGIGLVVLNWSDTQVEVAWPDIPFEADFANLQFNSETRQLAITSATATASVPIATLPNPGASYGVITSVPTGSIYENDSGISLNNDLGYIRVLSGTVDSINVATGLLGGITAGAVVEYAIFDVSLNEWSN